MGLKEWEEINLIADVREVKEIMHDQPRPAPRKYVEKKPLTNAELIVILSSYLPDAEVLFEVEDERYLRLNVNTITLDGDYIVLSNEWEYE